MQTKKKKEEFWERRFMDTDGPPNIETRIYFYSIDDAENIS